MNKFRALGAAALLMITPSVAASETVDASYEFRWKGIRVSSAEARATVAEERYDFSLNFRMRGIAKLFANGRSEVTARGRLGPDGMTIPEYYNSNGRWDGKDYDRTLTFDANGNLVEMEQDWPEKWLEEYKREPVPADLQRGPDPASLAVALMQARVPDVATAEGVKVQVFDGDSVFEYGMKCSAETTVLEESKHSVFSGPAHECFFEGKLVAGKRILTEKQLKKQEKERAKAEKRRKKGEEEKEEEPPRFWLAEQGEAGYLVPVRADMPTDMGRVLMYLKDFTVTPAVNDTVVTSR
ncbi:MAG: DUF3108 domain-containing protein [Alphaproteobacteria bacterium]|nr:DUF3108 domain-containing protein [Alphaproteobacteria bacterium]